MRMRSIWRSPRIKEGVGGGMRDVQVGRGDTWSFWNGIAALEFRLVVYLYPGFITYHHHL